MSRSFLDLKYLEIEIVALIYLDVKLLFCETMGMTKTDDRDHVDAFLESIHLVLPDLDLEVEGIVDRISGLARRLQRSMDETLAEFGLDTAENKVLSILAQSGEPFRSTPGRLAARMELSSGRDDQPARPAGASRAGAAVARPRRSPQRGGGADRPRPQDVPEGRRGAGQEGGSGHRRAERAGEGAAERAAAADDARVRATRAGRAG